MLPSPPELAILVLAAYRIWRLLGVDDFPPIARARDWLTGAKPKDDDWSFRRPTLAHFLGCPYCLGAWVSFALYVPWLLAPTAITYVAAPLAISGAVGLIGAKLDG